MSSSIQANDTQFYHFNNRQAARIACFIGGYIDIVGYILLYFVFVASITGNIVKFARGIDDGMFTTNYFVASVAFGIGSMIGKLFHMYLKSFSKIQDQHIVCIFMATEAILLFIPMMVGGVNENFIASDPPESNRGLLYGVGILLAVAMGFQNIGSGMVLKGFPNTTGMTATIALAFSSIGQIVLLYLALGGWVNWGLTFSEEQALHKMSIKSTVGESSTATMDVLHTAKRALLEVKLNTAIDEMYKQWSILLSFIIGAIIGGAIALQISFWSISISVFLCLFLCIEGYWQLVFNSKIQKDGIKANKSQCSAPVDAPVLESLSNGKGSLISPTTNDINTISNMSKDEKETEMVGMNASNIAIAIGNCDKIDEHKSSSQTSDILCDESRPLSTTLLSTALLSTSTDTRNNEVTSSPVPLSLYIEPPQSSQSPTRGYDSSGKNKEYRTGNSDNSSVRNEDDKDIFGVASFSSISASHRMKLSRLLKSLRPSEYNALVQSLILNRDHKRRESNVNKNNGLVLQSNQNSNEQSPISSSNRANSLAVLNADSMIIDETVLECLQNGQGSSITKPRSGSMSAYNSLSPAMQSAVMQSHNIQKIYNNADLDYNI